MNSRPSSITTKVPVQFSVHKLPIYSKYLSVYLFAHFIKCASDVTHVGPQCEIMYFKVPTSKYVLLEFSICVLCIENLIHFNQSIF